LTISLDVNISWILKLSIEFIHVCWGLYEILSDTPGPIFFLLHLFIYFEEVSGTVLLILVKRANISIPIDISYHSRSMHLIVFELALVIRAITEDKPSILQGIVFKCAFEGSFSNIVDEFAFTVELSIDKISFIPYLSLT